MKHVRITSEQDSKQIADLRISAYQSSKDFRLVNSNFLEWGEKEKTCPVIGVWNNDDNAIATILLIVVDNAQKAARTIEYDLPIEVPFPALVFSRAATKQTYRRRGFNQLIRYHCIKAALECNINSLLSPVFEHATRTGFMKEMGYQFYTPQETCRDKIIPANIRKLAVLERSKMEYAVQVIEQRIPDLIREYPWDGDPIIF